METESMRSLKRIVLLAAFVSPLVTACSSTTLTQETRSPEAPRIETISASSTEPTNVLSEPIQIAPQLINGWPADTPDLQDAIFNFEVTGDPKRVLSDGDSGFLIIQSERTSEAAKLIFYEDKRAQYRLPASRFKILTVGPSLICRDISFDVPEGNPNGSEFNLRIRGSDGAEPSHQWAYLILVSSDHELTISKACRSQEGWAKYDALVVETASSGRQKKKTSGGKVAEGAAVGAGAVALLILKVLVSIAAHPVNVGGGGQ